MKTLQINFLIIIFLIISIQKIKSQFTFDSISLRQLEENHAFQDGRITNFDWSIYRYKHNTLKQFDKDTSKFAFLDSMDIGKFYGPFIQSKQKYYLIVTKKFIQNFYSFQEAQLYQSQGVGDDLFQKSIERLKTKSLNDKLSLRESIKRTKDSNYYLMGRILHAKNKALVEIPMELREFLLRSTLYETTQWDKIKIFVPKSEMIQVFQNLTHQTKYQVIIYIKVELKNNDK